MTAVKLGAPSLGFRAMAAYSAAQCVLVRWAELLVSRDAPPTDKRWLIPWPQP